MKAKDFERQYSAGQLIVERGSEVRQLFIVRSGNVVLDRDDGSEPRLIGSGQVFGELPGVLGSPSPYRAEADEDATVLVLDDVLINKMCDENAEFAARLVRHLAEELQLLHDRGALADLDQRLAQGYKKLVPVIFSAAYGDRPPLPVSGGLRDLAAQAGLSVLDAYFCVQRLLESRVLRLVEDQLAIVEAHQLRELVGAERSPGS